MRMERETHRLSRIRVSILLPRSEDRRRFSGGSATKAFYDLYCRNFAWKSSSRLQFRLYSHGSFNSRQRTLNLPLFSGNIVKLGPSRSQGIFIRMFTHNVLWPKPVYYPMGNTSATFLLQSLPPEQDAAVLLLGCGDPRHILFTAYNVKDDESRNVDFTCCDIQPAILARNILLLSLILDDNTGENSLKYWKTFYHFVIDNDSLSIIRDQAQKLVKLSETIDTWHGSTYGSILRMVGKDTLSQLRSFWGKYFETTGSSKRQSSITKFREGWRTAMKSSHKDCNVVRALGPFSASSMNMEAVMEQRKRFWDTGVAGGNTSDEVTAKNPNPMFMYTAAGDEFVVYIDQNPLLGFHLEMAHAEILKNGPFGEVSGLRSRATTRQKMFDYNVEVAKTQFKAWSNAFNNMARRNKIVIRFHLGDVLRFCRALEICREKGPEAASFDYAQVWRAAPLKLDGGDYNASSHSPAPMTFDVIETSNLSDHIGLLNLLIAAAPVLSVKPSSMLYTETFRGAREEHSMQLVEFLCGDVVTMSLLLGIAPTGYVTGVIPNSFAQECTHIRNSQSDSNECIRISWKKPMLGDEIALEYSKSLGEPRCIFDSEELAMVLFQVYNMMFRTEDPSIIPLLEVKKLRNYSHRWYTRRTYAELLRLVKGRVDTDWHHCMNALLEKIFTETPSESIGVGSRSGFLDLLLHMHQSGVYTEANTKLGPLGKPSTSNIQPSIFSRPGMLEVVTIVLKIPRSTMKDFYKNNIGRTLCAGLRFPELMFMTSSVQTVYGKLICSKDGLTAIIEEDINAGDFLISFKAQKNLLFIQHPGSVEVVLYILPTVFEIPLREYDDLKSDHEVWMIYESNLTNENEVTVLHNPPGIMLQRPIIEAHLRSPSTVSVNPHKQSPGLMVYFNKAAQVETFKTRLDYHPSTAESRALSKYSEPTLVQNSPCTVDITIPGCNHQTLVFPYPVDASRAEISVSPKPSFFSRPPGIEVLIPPSRPTDKAGFNLRMLQTINTTPPIVWDMPRINLDKLPILDIESHQDMNWLELHLSCMYSDREHQNPPDNEETRIRSNLKNTLTSIFLNVSGALPGQTSNVFAISSHSNIKILIFISNIRLDFGSRTVVADVRVLPLIEKIASSEKQALEALSQKGIFPLSVGDAELERWREILPALTERCRNWKHTPSCEYLEHGIPVSTLAGVSPLCSCGVGKAPQVISEIEEWKPFEKYWTRAAITPIFAFPYAESCDMAIEKLKNFRSVMGTIKKERILNTDRKASVIDKTSPKPSGGNTNSPKQGRRVAAVDIKGTGAVVRTISLVQSGVCHKCKRKLGTEVMVICGRCKKASYCSVNCRKEDWGRHKKVCKN